jgi:hypothetical protein
MNHLGMESNGEDTANLIEIFRRYECGLVAEVGSWVGATACRIADAGIKVICVDTFVGSTDPSDLLSGKGHSPETAYATWLSNVGDRYLRSVSLIRMDTAEAATLFPEECLDGVFIDACHNYESVKADVAAWERVVKRNGVIACHDYSWFPGVKQALNERGGFTRIGPSLAWWRK